MTKYPFRKSNQIEKCILQFMRVFSGFQSQDGVARDGSYNTKRIPVVYGGMSRIVASVLNKKDYMVNKSLPMFAVVLTGIQPDPENRKSSRHIEERRVTTGDPVKPFGVMSYVTGPALQLNFDLSIYASSLSELFEISEQILLTFNPRVVLQTSSDIKDSNYITDIVLEGIQPEIQYPMGTENRECMMTFNFTVPFRLKNPVKVEDRIIEHITSNVREENGTDLFITDIYGDIETGEIEVVAGN